MDEPLVLAALQDHLFRVLRFLMARSPRRAEAGYESLVSLAKYRAAGGDPGGKWLRYEGGIPGYRMVNSEETEGRTVFELPAGVAPEDVISIKVDPDPRHLLQWLHDIADDLRSRLPQESKVALDTILANVASCYDEDQEKNLFARFAEQGMAHAGIRDRERQFVQTFLKEQELSHSEWRLSGDTLALFVVVAVLARSLIAAGPTGGSGVGPLEYYRAIHFREPSLLGLCGLLSQFGGLPPRMALGSALDLVLRKNHLELLIKASRAFKAQADESIEVGLNASNLQDFHESLFWAVPRYTAAKIGFDFLRENKHVTEPALREEFLRESVLGCEEKIARAVVSLSNSSFDLDGRLLRERRAVVQAVRQEKGPLAAERQITQFIELEYYYPRSFRKYLEG